MKVTGFAHLRIVNPHPLAEPSHPQAQKLAVGAQDILERADVLSSLDRAIGSVSISVATSARPGISGVLSPRTLAHHLVLHHLVLQGGKAAVLFGGERTGLRRAEVDRCDLVCRIPMVANEPSLNLAQAVMVILYELMLAAIEAET